MGGSCYCCGALPSQKGGLFRSAVFKRWPLALDERKKERVRKSCDAPHVTHVGRGAM